MRNNWTQEELTMLRNNYGTMSKEAICTLIPTHSYYAIKHRAFKMGLKKEMRFSKEDIEYLKANYATTKNSELAAALGCDVMRISKKAFNMGLKKDREFFVEMGKLLTESGRGYRYPKGNIPANKGKKMSEETKKKCAHTYFKKGHTPHNALPDWAEVINKDGYIMIKLPDRRKITFKHWWIWEQANGKRPKGHCVQFRDGNPLNCVLENLYIISRADQVRQNSICNYPPEIRQAMARIGKINKLIKEQK